jgi:hypothetical protein
VIVCQLTRRVSARTTSPVPIRVPPPMSSRTTSRPVKGSDPEFALCCVVDRALQVCGLYAWHVELPVANAVAGTSKAITRTRAAMGFISSSDPLFGADEAVDRPLGGVRAESRPVRALS